MLVLVRIQEAPGVQSQVDLALRHFGNASREPFRQMRIVKCLYIVVVPNCYIFDNSFAPYKARHVIELEIRCEDNKHESSEMEKRSNEAKRKTKQNKLSPVMQPQT